MAIVISEKTSLGRSVEMEASNGVTLKPADKNFSQAPLHLPEWFFRNCVKTSEELNEHDHRLTVCNNGQSLSKSAVLPVQTVSNLEVYEIESAMYNKLNDFASVNSSSGGYDWMNHSINGEKAFVNDGAMLRFPDDTKSLPFLTAVIECFAKGIGADLITMSFEDFEDLCEHFAVIQRRKKCNDVDCRIKLYFDQNHLSEDKEDKTHTLEEIPEPEPEQETYSGADDGPFFSKVGKKKKKGKKKASAWDEEEEVNVEVSVEEVNPELENQTIQTDASPTVDDKAFPFSLILQSTAAKRELKQGPKSLQAYYHPLIIHIRGVHKFMDDKIQHSILIKLRNYVQISMKRGNVLLITTDCNSRSNPYQSSLKDSSILSTIGRNPARAVTRIVPVKSQAQRSLLKKDEGREIERENIRKLQRRIRQYPLIDKNSFLLQPNASWCLDGSQASKLLRKKLLDGDEFEETANSIARKLEVCYIEKVLVQNDENTKALDDWNQSSDEDKWLSFPLKAQKAIAEIESNRSEYSYEHDMLSLLVNPDNVEQTWADIELDEEVTKAITQMVALTMSDRQETYGILKTGRIGGALLYGPPGTGKTQLARVLARETRSKAVMIHASTAEIEEKWVGETEKIIKALFNLGRMLSPSIVFIDEADALFKARGRDDRSHERNRISQLLAETDGMTRAPVGSQPFLLLATNFPHQLDSAVLRRVPGRLFIGMPTLHSRERIFSISLRNEGLDEALNLRELAARTRGYTGSDIQTVCVQAALICQDELDKQDGKMKRVLRDTHFQEALRRSGPTVSRKLLGDIKEFAAEFDPAAVAKLNFVEPDTWSQLNSQKKNVVATEPDEILEQPLNSSSEDTNDINRGVDLVQQNIVNNLLGREHYSYQSLSISDDETTILDKYRPIPRIRLLHLFPGKGLEPLQGSLEISSPFPQLSRGRGQASEKDSNIPYEAISYCWGDSNNKEDIICNGKRQQITASLARALRRVRLPARIRVLWADGICINQNDIEERTQQVMFMAAIYSQAERVLCWLGEDEEDHAKHTFDIAQRFCMKVERPPDDGEYTEMKGENGEIFHADHYLHSALNIFEDDLEQELKTTKVRHMKSLFKKSWFTRMWIRQEIGYASKALVLCGDTELDWNDLEWFRSWASFKCHISAGGNRMKLGNFRNVKYLVGNTASSFFDLLLESSRFQCTEPRDRIFALLSHPSAYKELRTGMMRNYSVEVVEAISNREEKAIIDEKIKSAWSALYADISRFTASLAEELEGGDPGKEFFINAAKVLETSSGILGGDYLTNDVPDKDLERLIAKRSERRTGLESARFYFSEMVYGKKHTKNATTLEDQPVSSDSWVSEKQVDNPPAVETDNTDEKFDPEDKSMHMLISFLSEARRLDELETPAKHPLYRLQPMSGEAVLSVPIIKADYSRTLEDIYLEIARQILHGSLDLRILSTVDHDGRDTVSRGTLPSWVPRWDTPIKKLKPGLLKSYSQTQPWTNKISFKEAVQIEGETLNCHGFIIDTITSTTAPISRNSFLDIDTLLNFWKPLISWPTPKHPTASDKLKLYQRLLTLNNAGNSIMSILGLGPHNEKLLADFAAYWISFHKAERNAIEEGGTGVADIVPGFFAVTEMEELAERGIVLISCCIHSVIRRG
ncbi:hypothetical protein B0J11DRAFT_615727 [Dendryphion nanum]|uniref:AAA+ ATPase domain-containing protein n=1 Tax=Dendryphion nanum TaxID=256645 RepID=A0A9P9DN73_9PLEO|nr:hypothetical protein B0J11DRAFT_615727 [Dendryphion nanum]